VTANCGDQIERRETGVGDDDDLAIRQPSPNLENGLAGPIRQLLVTVIACDVVTFGGGQNGQEGQAQRRRVHGMGTMAMSESQRRPLVLTK